MERASLKNLKTMSVLLVVGCLSLVALAEGPGGGQGYGPGQGRGQGLGRGGRGRADIKAKLIAAAEPTDEQLPQIEQIFDTHRQAMKNWHNENRDKIKAAREKLRQARQGDDEAARTAARKELRAINKGRRALREDLKKQLAQVLSEEQMKKVCDAIRPRGGKGGHFGKGSGKGKGHYGRKGHGPGGYLSQLKLTDEQQAKVKEIMKAACKDAQAAEDRHAKRTIFAKARKKVFDSVLRADQRKKVKELRRKDHPLYGIATDKQIDRANKIMAKAHKAAAKAKTPEERRKINAAAREKVRKEVLTADQRKKLNERHKQRRAKMRKRFADKVGLSDKQQTQARKIMDEAREKARLAKTRQERREIMRAAHEKIRKEVMTDEQREKLEDLRPHGKRCGNRRGPGPANCE